MSSTEVTPPYIPIMPCCTDACVYINMTSVCRYLLMQMYFFVFISVSPYLMQVGPHCMLPLHAWGDLH